jgi:hypothetical protein
MSEQETEERTFLDYWRFENRKPTQAEILDLLEQLEPVHGVNTVDYAQWVMPFPQRENRKIITEQNGKKYEMDNWVDIFQPYMAVAGKIKMLEKAQEINDWVVEFVPETQTMTNSAGIIFMGDAKVAYRVTIVIHKNMEDGSLRLVGSRTGMSARTGANNWEKAETAAQGRALSGWGFGVFPGASIASLDEMQSAEPDEPAPRQKGPSKRSEAYGTDNAPSREELVQDIAATMEQIRLLRKLEPLDQEEKNRDYLVKTLRYAFEVVWDPYEQRVDYSKVQTFHLVTMADQAHQVLAKLEAQEAPL